MSNKVKGKNVPQPPPPSVLTNSEITYTLERHDKRISNLESSSENEKFNAKASIAKQKADLFSGHIKIMHRACFWYSAIVAILVIADGIECVPFELHVLSVNALILSTGVLLWRLLSLVSNAVFDPKDK